MPLLGELNDLPSYISQHPVDRIVFTLPNDGRIDKLAATLQLCRDMGIEIVFLPQLAILPGAQIRVEYFFGMPVVQYTNTPQQVGALLLKQAMDVIFALTALVLLLPVFAVIAVCIKLDSPGPVFFSQMRSGLQGRPFRCLKFRTMHVNAEQRLAELRHLNEMSGPVFKMKNDPRVTRIGRFLRKYSLDELPQFINVLMGDMSLVGPRPPLPAEVAQYEPWQRRRLAVKPGLTCIWQVSGRNNLDFDRWVKLDLEYIDQWSLALDCKLPMQTVLAVVRGTGV